MDVFINDCLLQGELLDRHLEDIDSFLDSLKKLSDFCEVIQNKKLEYNNQVVITLNLSKQLLNQLFEFINTKDIEGYIVYKLSKLSPKYWDEKSIQDHQKQYYFVDSSQIPPINHLINNTSLAEAYEHKLKYSKDIIALNFPDSILSNHNVLMILTIKDKLTGGNTIACGDSDLLLAEWIDHNIDKKTFFYDYESSVTPTDLQTCLRSKIRFEETNKCADNGRKIYVEKINGYQWYVDNAHNGKKSHIEVFDSLGSTFIGEANLDGVLIPKKENPHNKTKAEKAKAKRRIRK